MLLFIALLGLEGVAGGGASVLTGREEFPTRKPAFRAIPKVAAMSLDFGMIALRVSIARL